MTSKRNIVLSIHVLPVVLVTAAGLGAGLRSSDPLAGAILASQVTGYASLLSLLLSLAAGPFHRLAAKHLGLLAAELALVHSLVSLWGYLGWRWGDLVALPFLRAGLGALAILVLLYLVSGLRQRMEASTWRAFFLLGHLAALLALVHATLAPFGGGLRLVAAGAAVLAAVVIVKLARAAGGSRASRS